MTEINKEKAAQLLTSVLVPDEESQWHDVFQFKSDKERLWCGVFGVVGLVALPFVVPPLIAYFGSPGQTGSVTSMVTFVAVIMLGLILFAVMRDTNTIVSITNKRMLLRHPSAQGFEWSLFGEDIAAINKVSKFGSPPAVQLVLTRGRKTFAHVGEVTFNGISDVEEFSKRLDRFRADIPTAPPGLLESLARADSSKTNSRQSFRIENSARDLMLYSGLALAILGWVYINDQKHATWPTAVAEVVSTRLEDSYSLNSVFCRDFSRKYYVYRNLKYKVDGKEYEAEAKGADVPHFDNRQQAEAAAKLSSINVLYDPDKPSNMKIDLQAAARTTLVLIYICGAFFLSGLELKLRARKENFQTLLIACVLILANCVLASFLFTTFHQENAIAGNISEPVKSP
ncbi:MAG: DUF3592 domain-containing protein [Candidatus Obscuribacterales bacterium]|nr:DUF3592 domain-containing protein [Candidatus Obscuribacterales bacterium]